MKQLIKDWTEFCENGKVFEDGHFYTLFMDIDPNDIREVFKYFPNSDRLVNRMENFITYNPGFTGDLHEKKEKLSQLLELDWEERKPFIKDLPSFSELVENCPIVFTPDLLLISDLILDDVWSQDYQDFLRIQKISTEKKIFVLYDALYGKASDFDYSMYLFEPLLKINYSLQSLFEFKKLGGVYAITEGGIYFSFKQ